MQCQIEDVFYGGARGGGKTDGLLGDFLGHAHLYGGNARGILFRRTLEELVQVVDRSREIYAPLGWIYKEQKRIWSAPNGATLRLQYLDNDADAANYQGQAYTWMAFDELGNWPSPRPIDKLWGCLRSAHGVPCVRRATGNPGGPGHAWVKKRYIDHGPYVVHTEYPDPERAEIHISSVFIPSTLDDNLLLQKNDPGYESRLRKAGGESLFRAWRYGDWDVLAGQYFDCFDPAVHVVRPGEYIIEPWHPKWISMDWGFEDDAAIHWHRSNEGRHVVTFRELVANHMTPVDLGKAIVRNSKDNESYDAFYLSRDAFHKRHSERTIADEIYEGIKVANAEREAKQLPEIYIPYPTRCDDNRVGGWMLMYQMLKNGTWVMDESCKVLTESLPMLVRDIEKNPEDCMESKVDHAPDSARYGLQTRVRNLTTPESDERMARALAHPDINDRAMAVLVAQAANESRGRGVRLRRYR